MNRLTFEYPENRKRRGESMIPPKQTLSIWPGQWLHQLATFMGQSGKQESPELSSFPVEGTGEWLRGKVDRLDVANVVMLRWCRHHTMWSCGPAVRRVANWGVFQLSTKRLSCGFVVLNYQKERGSGGKRLSMHGTTRGFQFHSRITLFTFHQLQHSRRDHVIRRVPRWMSFCRAIGYGNLFDAIGTRVPYCQFDSLKKLTSQNQLRCGNVGRVVNPPGDIR